MFRPTGAASTIAGLALVARLAAAEAAHAAASADPWPDYRVVQWTTAQGLPQNTVTDIVFLPSGEMWLATFGGLARFDGHGLQGPRHGRRRGAAREPDRLPGGHRGGLVPVPDAAGTPRARRGRPERAARPAAGRVARSASSCWSTAPAACSAGRPTGGSGGATARARGSPSSGTPSGSGGFHALALDESGEVWGIRGERLVRLAGGPPAAPVSLPEREITLAPRSGGGLWLGLRGGVARFLDGRLDRLEIRPALERKVSAIEPAGDDALWVATSGDVSRLDRQADGWWRRTSLPVRLPGLLSVRSLRLDSGGRPLDRDRRQRALPRQPAADPSIRRGVGPGGRRCPGP